jgi:hypothetical protein
MTHKSDFYSAKLPRYLKKMIALGEAAGSYDRVQAREHRKGFIDAHATHLAYKLKRVEKDTTPE